MAKGGGGRDGNQTVPGPIIGKRPGLPFGTTGTLVPGGGNQNDPNPTPATWRAPPPVQQPRAVFADMMVNNPRRWGSERGGERGWSGGGGAGWGGGIGGGMGGRSSGGLY
jgi:hypothetical protein